MRYNSTRSELNRMKEFTKTEKILPVAFITQVSDGYLDENGKFHKNLSEIQAKIFIVDDLPKSEGGVLVGEKV